MDAMSSYLVTLSNTSSQDQETLAHICHTVGWPLRVDEYGL